MGNTQSDFDDSKTLGAKSKRNMHKENALQEERIKNQILQTKLEFMQKQINQNRNSYDMLAPSKNPLLSNPQLQNEFYRNKKMQKEFLEMLIKEKSKDITNEQYQKINNFLQNLDTDEDELNTKKPHLYMNQGSGKYVSNYGEEKKFDIGNNIPDRERLMRQLKKEKLAQENKMKEEQKVRKSEYEAKLFNLDEDTINPYKILEISPGASLNEMKNAYKRKARIYHPDKIGGNDYQFKIITRAFAILIEKYKKEQSDKQFMTLREESKQDLERQRNESKRNTNFKKNPVDMQGRNFNQKKFNRIFDDNRIVQPGDEGYGKWMSENEYETDKIKQVINKNQYSQQSFNNIFVNQKQKKTQAIQKYQQPQALYSNNGNSCSVLGEENISDFSGISEDSKKGVGYTDYKKAHTETTLIDPDNVNYREYDNLDDLEKERSKKLFLSKEELEQIKMNEMMEQQREDARRNRLSKNDENAFNQFERVNKMFLGH